MDRQAVAREEFIREMRSRGVNSLESAPLFWRLLWACGSEIRPPHFFEQRRLRRFLGIGFAACWVPVFAPIWYGLGHPLDPDAWASMLIGAVLGGWLFGAWLSRYYRREALRLGLPTWEEYVERGGGPVDPIREAIAG